ncbi:MAG: tetratricopeptide repeat protein [Vicinamibacterales bacterium]
MGIRCSLAPILLALAVVAPVGHAQSLADEQARREALAHYRAGQELLAAERWDKALIEFQQAVKLDPLLTDAHYGMGQAYMGLRRFASAAHAYGACIDAARSLHGLRVKNRVEADRQLEDQLRELRETLRRMQTQPNRALRALQLEQRIQDLERMRAPAWGSRFNHPRVCCWRSAARTSATTSASAPSTTGPKP